MSWPLNALNNIFELSGKTRAGLNNYPVLSITMKHGLVDQADKFKKRIASKDVSKYRVAFRNELVVGFPIDEGVLGFQTKYDAGIVSPAYDIWKLKKPSEIHIPYLELYLRSKQARSLYASKMQGAVARRRSLTKENFLKLEIPFPDKNNQIRIALLLTKVKKLIAQRTEHLQDLDELLQSVFVDMFGDPVQNEKGLKIKPLSSLGSINRGISKHRPRNAPELLGGRHPLIQTGDVSRAGTYISKYNHTYSDIGLSQSKIWPAGTLCITIAANIAQTGILQFDACFPDSVVGLSVYREESNALFIHTLFSFFQRILEKNAPAAAQKNINLEILRNLKVPVPSIEQQNQFSAVAEKIEHLKAQYQRSLTDLEQLYGALSQQAFKGELDLSRVPLPAEVIQPTDLAAKAIDDFASLNLEEYPMDSPQGRARLLREWFSEFVSESPIDTAVSLEQYWQSVRRRSVDYSSGELLDETGECYSSNFEVEDYDKLKTWIFNQLEKGYWQQVFDEQHNQLRLQTKRSPG